MDTGERRVLLFPYVRTPRPFPVGRIVCTSARDILGAHAALVDVFTEYRGCPVGDCLGAELPPDHTPQETIAAAAAIQFLALRHPDVRSDPLAHYVVPIRRDNVADQVLIETSIGTIAGARAAMRVPCPWPHGLVGLNLERIDVSTADTISNCGTSSDPARLRLFRAIQVFIRASAANLTWEERLLFQVMAAEALLDVPDAHNHREFRDRFGALFGGSRAVAEWADAAYGVRSSIVHGQASIEALRLYQSTTPADLGSADPAPPRAAGYHDVIAGIAVQNGILKALLDLGGVAHSVDMDTVRYILRQGVESRTISTETLVEWLVGQGTEPILTRPDRFARLQYVAALLPDRPNLPVPAGQVHEWKDKLRARLERIGMMDRGYRFADGAVATYRRVIEHLDLWEALSG